MAEGVPAAELLLVEIEKEILEKSTKNDKNEIIQEFSDGEKDGEFQEPVETQDELDFDCDQNFIADLNFAREKVKTTKSALANLTADLENKKVRRNQFEKKLWELENDEEYLKALELTKDPKSAWIDRKKELENRISKIKMDISTAQSLAELHAIDLSYLPEDVLRIFFKILVI